TIVVAVAAHAAHATCRAPVAPGRREGAGAALVNPQRALAVAPGTTLDARRVRGLRDQLRTTPVADAAFLVLVALAVALHMVTTVVARMADVAGEQAGAALVDPQDAATEAPGLVLDALRVRSLLDQARVAPVGAAFLVTV